MAVRVEIVDALPQALRLLAEGRPPVHLLAGGTDLLVEWRRRAPDSGTVVVLGRIGELQVVEERRGGIFIGAGVTHAALRDSALLQARIPALVAAASGVGSRQIQSAGTVGGNIANASPAADLAPPLLVADAEVVVRSVRGERSVPLRRFFRGYRKTDLRPAEMIVGFLVRPLEAAGVEVFRKLGARSAHAIAKVSAAMRLVRDGKKVSLARIALGSAAEVPIRAEEAEQWLEGRELSPETIQKVGDLVRAAVRPIDDVRSTADYRRWVAGNLVRGFVEMIAAGD